jgi:4-amino-4-deoxy-L-arabinose transferase-like glycosyltransferase
MEDPDNYLPLARSLASGSGFAFEGRPTAYRPPLYPLVLAPLTACLGPRVAWGVACLHLLLGGATVWLTGLTAVRWGLNGGRALAAAAVVALDPVIVAQGRSVMTETLAAFLYAAALLGLTLRGTRSAVAGGLALGLGSLCRPSAIPVAALTVGASFVFRTGSLRLRLTFASLLAGVTAATITPWAARNMAVFGEPVWTTTHGGWTLSLANNPVYYRDVLDGPPGAVWQGHEQWVWWDSVHSATRGLSEPQADRAIRGEALSFIASHPRQFARACADRLGRFWGLAPSGSVYRTAVRVATGVWTAPLWALLGLSLVRAENWRWPRVVAPLTLVGLSAVHAVYWTDQRMRAPAVPAVALLAASARIEWRPWCPGNGRKKK